MRADSRAQVRSEQDLRGKGIKVTTLPEAEKEKFRAAVQPLYDSFAAQAELIERIQNT